MYKVDFKLKQHTPLIHFQHDQDGATLRATEVKPKLDKYLLEMLFGNDFESVKMFLTGYTKEKEMEIKRKFNDGFKALDYKVLIVANPKDIEIIPIDELPKSKFPCFFGNMGDENKKDPKRFSYTSEPIQIVFKTYHKKIADSLKTEVPNFFARHNFGTRQSKGFGSFYINEIDEKYEIPGLYSFFTSIAGPKEFSKLFKDIELVHKVLRSGINDKGRGGVSLFYMKPLIWQYFRKKGISWEKRKIKQEFYNSELNHQMKDHEIEIDLEDRIHWPLYFHGEEYKIVKDLLGLSSLENWREPYKTEIRKESDSIDRMKSPFFYKPIKTGDRFNIFIDFDLFNNDFLNAEFKIKSRSNEFSLTTAAIFDVDDFFSWCFSGANILKLIDERYRESPKAKEIQKIFTELRSNINN
jgi:hypothetical protein